MSRRIGQRRRARIEAEIERHLDAAHKLITHLDMRDSFVQSELEDDRCDEANGDEHEPSLESNDDGEGGTVWDGRPTDPERADRELELEFWEPDTMTAVDGAVYFGRTRR